MVKKVDGLLGDESFIIAERHANSFNILVDAFNMQIEALSTLTSDADLQRLCFPSKKSTFPRALAIDWNSPSSLSSLGRLIRKHKLHPMLSSTRNTFESSWR